jgi:DNA-directed RNA polymerase subunit RPC12/RpoP
MVTYWCSYCGTTAERRGPNESVPCPRCIAESIRIFGFWPRALMQPLEPGEVPATPLGARRQFVFRDARSGEERMRTEAIRPPSRAAS